MKNLARLNELALVRQQRNDAEVERILSDPASVLLPAHEFARSVAQAKVAGYGVGVDAAVDAALDAFERRVEAAVYRATNIATREAVQVALRREGGR